MRARRSEAEGWRGLAVCRLLLWLFVVCAVFEAPLGSRSHAADNALAGLAVESIDQKRSGALVHEGTREQFVAQGTPAAFDGQRSGDLGDEVILPGPHRFAQAVPERQLVIALPALLRIRAETGAPGARAPPGRG